MPAGSKQADDGHLILGEQFRARQTFHRLGRAIAMFLTAPESGWKAKLLIAALLVLMIGINGMNVANSFVNRFFMSAIEARDWKAFIFFAWVYVAVFAVTTLVAVIFRFAEERLGLLWRDWLTHRMVRLYIDQRIYLRLEEASSITNPDQRIAEDVRSVTVTTLSFVLMIVNGTITAVSFSGVLWSISPLLFVVAVVYAAVGSAFTVLLGRPLIRLNYRQADAEADFRSELIRVRENAELIALTGNESLMRQRLLSRVDILVRNFRKIIAVNRNLNFFTTGYNYMIQIIPTLIVAPLFIFKDVEFGIIAQSAMAFATLLGAFSLIVTQFQSVSAYASVIARLSELVEASDRAATRNEESFIHWTMDADRFSFADLTLRSEDEERRVLLDMLGATFAPGRPILVNGRNEAARHALFRAAAGLYLAGAGSISRPPPDRVAFLPEQPYIPPGTLREVLVPAGKESEIANREIIDLLHEVGLGPAFMSHDGFEIPRNWHDILSLEEQHLMGVVRALLAKPAFALMDGLESALQEETLSRVLQLMAGRGITCVLFSRGEVDRSAYAAALELHEDGSWEWIENR